MSCCSFLLLHIFCINDRLTYYDAVFILSELRAQRQNEILHFSSFTGHSKHFRLQGPFNHTSRQCFILYTLSTAHLWPAIISKTTKHFPLCTVGGRQGKPCRNRERQQPKLYRFTGFRGINENLTIFI